MAGEMIARAILDGDDRWRLFSPYELVWAGGKFGRAAAQTIAWTARVRDAAAERISRYRDKARRQAAAQQAQWDVEHAKRRAETEARRVEAETKRAAEEEARRSEDEARKAELQARRATEQARRAMQAEAAKRTRERVDAARRGKGETAPVQATNGMPIPQAAETVMVAREAAAERMPTGSVIESMPEAPPK